MNEIKFRIAAKTDVGLVRQNNEDNFQASSDLSVEPMRWINNEICSLGEKGALLVVADGMGGMNAGEVASKLAIETVRKAFEPQNLTNEVMSNRYSIEKFMNSVVVEADKKIKSEAKIHPESRGMGTTIVIAWLLDGKLYVSWCGDSRAYVYNPQAGLHQISKDHSYVQSLVDKGVIAKEDAFDYPESNIITRCLSDSSTKARPESLLIPYEICDDDIIMLCTDGLNGMIRDCEIEEIIRHNEHDMDRCSDALIQAACDAEGSDNITICMCQILQGAGACKPNVFETFDKRLMGPGQNPTNIKDVISTNITGRGKGKILSYGIVLLLFMAIALGWYARKNGVFEPKKTMTKDSVEAVKSKGTQTIVASDGTTFTLERIDGNPKEGDKAYPNGTYKINDSTEVVIKDSTIVSVKSIDYTSATAAKSRVEENKGDTTKVKKKLGNKSSEKSINKADAKPKSTDDPSENILTPVAPTAEAEHEVKKGETLSSIAKKYGITVNDIIGNNPSITEETGIRPGDKIIIKKK